VTDVFVLSTEAAGIQHW